MTRTVLAVGLLVVIAACTSGAGGTEVGTVAVRLSGGPSAGELSFVPITSIDSAGNDIPPPDPDSVVTPRGDDWTSFVRGIPNDDQGQPASPTT